MNRRHNQPTVVSDVPLVTNSDDQSDAVIDLRATADLVDRRRPLAQGPNLRVAIDVSTALDSDELTPMQNVAVGLASAFDEDRHVELLLLDGRSGQLRMASPSQHETVLGRVEQTASATARRIERRLAKTGLRVRRWEPEAGTWFIDLEPAWKSPIPRSELLPWLEAVGVRISAFVPDLFRLHHPEWFPDAEVTRFRQWLRAHRTATSTWLAASLMTAEDLIRWLGPRSKNHDVKLLTLGVSDDVTSVRPTRAPADGRLLMVGPVAAHRGHRLLLSALDEFDREFGRSHRDVSPIVDVVGALSDDERLNGRLVEHSGVRLHHQLPKAAIDRLWSETSFLLSPCLGDGTGPTVVEALARRIPVIASDLPALAEASQGLATALAPNPTAWATFLRDRIEHHPVAVERAQRFKPVSWTQTGTELQRFLLRQDRPQRSVFVDPGSSGLRSTTRSGS